MGRALLIAMPAQGHATTDTLHALIDLTQSLARRGLPFAFRTYRFSDIVFSRNQLMSLFLTREEFTHLLMVDSDMAFEPEAVWRLLDFDAPFTVCAYPQKRIPWTRIRADIEAEAAKPGADRAGIATILSRNWIYNHQSGGFDGGRWTPKRRGGFVTVPAAGTGLLCVAREVPERMAAGGAAPRLVRHEMLPLHKGLRYHDFFSHRRSADGQLMYGEDQSFCHRWIEDCGGEIWLDTESPVSHRGSFGWSGTYADRLARDFPVDGALPDDD